MTPRKVVAQASCLWTAGPAAVSAFGTPPTQRVSSILVLLDKVDDQVAELLRLLQVHQMTYAG